MTQPWQQGQPGFQYPFQTGIPLTYQQQPQPGFGGGIQAQPTGFPGRAQPNYQQQPSNFQLQPTGFQQPQPTGFQQPQPTGFPGAGGVAIGSQTDFAANANIQTRGVPPVPPIPNRFQPQTSFPPPPVPPIPQAGSTFLSTTAQSRLLPQQTGYVPQGGAALLIPQVTGYVDPRLQAINTAFMPASVPYSAAGFPQFAQSSQGFNLQQSIQQINQSKGTTAPRIAWALSKVEKKQYDQIFRAWDTSGTGFISGETALQVFGASGLDKNDLARIWSLADINDQGRLSLSEFHVAMGLIYRRLNGSEIPEQLPPELVPPSQKDLDSSVDFVKDLLRKDSRPAGSIDTNSRLPSRSFNGNTSEIVNTRKDGTVYKYNDEGEYTGYKPSNRHLDRRTVRTGNESPSSDLSEMRRQLENASKLLEKASSESATRTAEDDALDKELEDLKYRVRRVQDDLEYVSRGPKSFSKDEERRKLERDLLHLMHTRLPELEKRIEERDRRKAREREDWARSRDRANAKYSRFEDDGYSSRRDRQRDEEYSRGYSRGTFESDSHRPSSRNNDREYDTRDRERDRERDRDKDHERGFSYRDRGYDRDRERERERSLDRARDRSPPPTRSPPPAPPAVAGAARLAPPAPSVSPLPVKNMTAEERRAYYQEEALRRVDARKRALGVATPNPSPTPVIDSSVQNRIDIERKEAEEKAKKAEMELEERERLRQQRLQNAKEAIEPKAAPPVSSPPAVLSPPPSAPVPAFKARAPAPPPPVRKAAPRPPVTPRTSSASTVPLAPPSAPPAPVPPVSRQPPAPIIPQTDPEEEKLRLREEYVKKEREARAARLRQLEAEEEEERRREEEYQTRRIAFLEAKATASRAQVASPAPPAPPMPVLVNRAKVPPPPAPSRNGSTIVSPPSAPVAAVTSVTATPAPVPAMGATIPTTPSAPSPTVSRTNPFNRLLSQSSNGSSTSTPSGGTNPFARTQQTPTPQVIVPSEVYPVASDETDEEDWSDIKEKDGDDSDGELDRKKFSSLAESIFGGPVSPSPAPVISAIASTPSAPSVFGAPEAADAPPPPPPPPPPGPPPPPAFIGAPVNGTSGSGDRGALFNQISSGAPRLRKTVTNDRSAATVAGAVLGDAAPPARGITRSPSPPSASFPPVTSYTLEEPSLTASAVSGVQVPATVQEEDESIEEHSVPAFVPAIQVDAPIGESDTLEDVDLQTKYKVRSLYPYKGQREEDLVFEENIILEAHPSKSGGPWWYGTIVRNGKKGFFPNNYVQELENVKAKTLYAYPGGNSDELPFSEGDELTIIDRSEGDWWKTERDGMILIVPAAYLEVIEAKEHLDSLNTKYDVTSISSPVSPVTAETNENGSGTERNVDSSDDTESDSDSDINNDQILCSEEDVLQEREARNNERMRVLEAAGIIIKEGSKGRPPPPVRRRSSRKRRAAPARPSRSSNARDSVTSITSTRDLRALPPVPDEDQPMEPAKPQLDDAYERYEAFKQQLEQRASIASYDSIFPSSPDTLTSGSPKPQEGKGRHSALLSFLGRKTPANDGERRSTNSLVISAPILPGSAAITRDNSPTFGLSWSSLVDKGVLEGIPNDERRRQEAIFELLMTENAYVRDLQLIVETFYASLMTKLDPKAITVIFANVEDILLTNTTLLSLLEERQRHCRLYVDNIGDIVERNMSKMGLYMQYCVNTGNAIKFLQSLRDSKPEIATQLQHLRDDPAVRGLDLSSYLLTPMQRITRYPLLIRQIIQYTGDQQELEHLETAVADVERILDAINEAIRSNESHERLKQISNNFWIDQGRLDLTQPTRYLGPRKLLKEGPLFKAKGGKKLHGILCNDILILAEDSARSLYRMPIPLTALRIEETSGRNDTDFKLVLAYPRGGEAINLRATSARDAQNWIKSIEQTRNKCVIAAEKRSSASIPSY